MSKALAESGADVAMMYVSNDKAQDLAAEISKTYNVNCKAYKANISDAEEVKTVIDQIYKDYGSIDIFVANAGISIGGDTEVKYHSFYKAVMIGFNNS
jgi:sorbose reductase